MKLKTLLLPFAALALCANAFAIHPAMRRWSVGWIRRILTGIWKKYD